MRTSIPRLRSVRFKDGRAPLRVIRPAEPSRARCRQFAASTSSIADTRPYLSGYAVVAWDSDGWTSIDMGTDGVPVTQMMVPEYVKTCLLDYVVSGNIVAPESK